MFKWLVVLLAVVFVLGLLQPRLARRLQLGRLPGDLRFTWRGREYVFPFVSTLLLSLLLTAMVRLVMRA